MTSVEEKLNLIDEYAMSNPGLPVSGLIRSKFPFLDTEESIEELRSQMAGVRVVARTPYPGRRAHVDPIEFLLNEYGSDIYSGKIGPGRLGNIDHSLYLAVSAVLGRRDPPQTIGDFFNEHTSPAKLGTPHLRRVIACADILGTSIEDAASFLASFRGDRSAINAQRELDRRAASAFPVRHSGPRTP